MQVDHTIGPAQKGKLPIKDVDFASAMGRKQKIDERIDSGSLSHDAQQMSSRAAKTAVNLPSDEQMDAFYERLSACGRKPAILPLIPKYLDAYVPKASRPGFPQPLQLLHQPDYLNSEYTMNWCMCVNPQNSNHCRHAQAMEKATKTNTNRSFGSSTELAG